MAEAAGGFDQLVVGLGAGSPEEDLAREPDVVGVDLLRELRLQGDLIEVGSVQQFSPPARGWR